MKAALAVLSLLAALAAPALAQPCGAAGLQIDFEPLNPTLGQPVKIKLTNISATCTYVLGDSCLYKKIWKNSCGGAVVIPFRQCALGAQFIPPGQSVSEFWGQADWQGTPVTAGLFFFQVIVDEVGGSTITLCPQVGIEYCPTPPVKYGTNSKGTGDLAPKWEVQSLPKPGGPFVWSVKNALGGAPALMLVGAAQAQVPTPFGELLVDLNQPSLALPFTMSGAAGGAGLGTVTFGVTVPNDAALVGVAVHMQCLVGDGQSTGGIAHTRGLTITVCPL